MKFKKGDKIRRKVDGVLDEVKSVPGMPEYDNQYYLSAEEGMVTKEHSWEQQRNWELVESAKDKPKFKVGDRVKLKEYTWHSDWEFHDRETGTIDRLSPNYKVTGHPKFGQMKYGFHIRWEDCSSSNAPEENLELVESKPEIQPCVEPETHIYGDNPYGVRFYETPKKKGVIPMLSILAKKLLDADVKALVEIGWLDSELDVTESGTDAILALFVEQNKAELAKRAKDELKKRKDK